MTTISPSCSTAAPSDLSSDTGPFDDTARSSVIMYDRSREDFRPEQTLHVRPGQRFDPEELTRVDAVVLAPERLPDFSRMERQVTSMAARVGVPFLPVLIRVNSCITSLASEAATRFEREVGRGSRRHLANVWYVGTYEGLLALARDLGALGFGDGVYVDRSLDA